MLLVEERVTHYASDSGVANLVRRMDTVEEIMKTKQRALDKVVAQTAEGLVNLGSEQVVRLDEMRVALENLSGYVNGVENRRASLASLVVKIARRFREQQVPVDSNPVIEKEIEGLAEPAVTASAPGIKAVTAPAPGIKQPPTPPLAAFRAPCGAQAPSSSVSSTSGAQAPSSSASSTSDEVAGDVADGASTPVSSNPTGTEAMMKICCPAWAQFVSEGIAKNRNVAGACPCEGDDEDIPDDSEKTQRLLTQICKRGYKPCGMAGPNLFFERNHVPGDGSAEDLEKDRLTVVFVPPGEVDKYTVDTDAEECTADAAQADSKEKAYYVYAKRESGAATHENAKRESGATTHENDGGEMGMSDSISKLVQLLTKLGRDDPKPDDPCLRTFLDAAVAFQQQFQAYMTAQDMLHIVFEEAERRNNLVLDPTLQQVLRTMVHHTVSKEVVATQRENYTSGGKTAQTVFTKDGVRGKGGKGKKRR